MYISILGDSISTYEGYNPIGYEVFYKHERLIENHLTDVADTWWMQVVKGMGGELCVNNSFSGSFVYETCKFSISAAERCQALHDGEKEPSAILVLAGTNDCLGGITPTDFYNGYTTLLKRIRERYPTAKSYCATLTFGSNGKMEMTERGYSMLAAHNAAIKKAAEENGAALIDLFEYKEYYPSNDGTHPNKDGHRWIAMRWLEQFKARGKV